MNGIFEESSFGKDSLIFPFSSSHLAPSIYNPYTKQPIIYFYKIIESLPSEGDLVTSISLDPSGTTKNSNYSVSIGF